MSLLTLVALIFSVVVLVGAVIALALNPKLFLLIFKNLRRNALRTSLTSIAIIAFAIMVSMIWAVVSFLDKQMEDQSQEIKLIVTERWQQNSQLPMSHADYLNPRSSGFLPELKGMIGDNDFMTWSFYFGTTDAKVDMTKMTLETMFFAFAMNPDHIKTMMDDLQDIPDELITELKKDRRNVVLGKGRLESLKMKPGDTLKVYGINFKGIDLEFRIVGELPHKRYDLVGIINADYFNEEMNNWYRNPNNAKKEQRHPLDEKRLNLIWLRVRDKDSVNKAATIIENSPTFAVRPVKCQTASSGIAAWLDPYRDLLFGVKWLLVPAILISMTLVISNAIAISVRERRTEMAVMKVLGFRPLQIQILVLGEAVLVGGLSGFLATAGCYMIINWVFGGIPFPVGWYPAFPVPWDALVWGFAIGAFTGLAGSLLPAWSARSVKVSEVFSKVA